MQLLGLLNQAQSGAGAGIIVVKFEDQAVLVARQPIVTTSRRYCGDAQQLRHVFLSEPVDRHGALVRRFLRSLRGRRRISRSFFGNLRSL